MSGMFEPRAPSPGWEKRWVIEALGLIPNSPAAASACLAGILMSGFLMNVDFGAAAGLQTFVTMFISLIVASVSVSIGVRMMGASEGYLEGAVSGPPVMRVLRSSFLIFMLICSFTAFSAGITEMIISAGGAARDAVQPTRGFLDQVVGDGSEMMVAAIIFSSMMGFLTLPCMVMLNVTYEQGLTLTFKAVQRCSVVIIKSIWVILPMAIFLGDLPYLLSGPICVIFCFWVYVAGREIFGGITGNRKTSPAFLESLT